MVRRPGVRPMPLQLGVLTTGPPENSLWTFFKRFMNCMSSLHRDHVHLLCIIPVSVCVLPKQAPYKHFLKHAEKWKYFYTAYVYTFYLDFVINILLYYLLLLCIYPFINFPVNPLFCLIFTSVHISYKFFSMHISNQSSIFLSGLFSK